MSWKIRCPHCGEWGEWNCTGELRHAYSDCDCDGEFYYHPIWHKTIYCPECGSFNVEEYGSVWHLYCNNCHDDFYLK